MASGLKQKSVYGTALVLVRSSAIAASLYVLFGLGHPPSEAQQPSRPQMMMMPVVTAEDAGQDKDIASMSKRIDMVDANNTRNWQATQKNATDIAGMQGEERGIGAFLALLSGTGLVLQVRNKKAA